MSVKEFWLVLLAVVVGSCMGAIIGWFIETMFTMKMTMPM